jgi:hypothetical protein
MTDLPVERVERVLDYPEPSRRPLRIFAFDPMVARLSGTETVTVTVPYEPLGPGPDGELVQVVDYDPAQGCCYEPVDLDNPRLLLQSGLPPSETDPRFHQQMVYAVVSALLESFERGLGRRFRWRGDERLRILPHAFVGQNARFVPDNKGSLQFGYFRASDQEPGRNLPGQYVFSCLSHDIVAHETTHALVHRLRSHYTEPTNRDVFGFHEGFADILALLQHFALPDLLERHLQDNRADVAARSPLVELAQQFGEGTGLGRALRSAIGEEPDPLLLRMTYEPHARGAILVAAVFDGFFAAYRRRISDLLRIATAGSGILPAGALHPDLVARIAAEARHTATRFQQMCIRAFQYLPPVDVTFGDFLRSVVTADQDVHPADDDGVRASLVEGFRARGIYPTDATSLVDEAIAWPAADRGLPPLPRDIVELLVADTAVRFRTGRGAGQAGVAKPPPYGLIAKKLNEYADANRFGLGLAPDLAIQVDGFHAAFRVGSRGDIRVDVAARFVQNAPRGVSDRLRRRLGGVPLRGGTTLVADATGRIHHVVSKPVPGVGGGRLGEQGDARLQAVLEWVAEFDERDELAPWIAPDQRVVASMSFARLDEARR